MEQTVVNATSSRTLGTRPSRRLRAEGKLPGVVYGLGREPVSVTVEYAELRDALKAETGLNTVLALDMGAEGRETVIVRAIQRDPLKRLVTHADFLRVDPEVPVKVKVPVKLAGDGTGVTNFGGMIEQKLFALEIRALPSQIPTEIEADISTLNLDRRISVGDLALPSGVTSTVDPAISVVTPVVSRAAKMAAREAAEGLGDDEESASEESGDESSAEGSEE